MTTQQPESLRLAEQYDYGDPAAHSNTWKVAVCTELRRQHIENETLRAGYAAARLEVESLKAQLVERAKEHADELTVAYMCGASGPLIGQPQAMPDLSQLTERGAKAWAGVDAQGLREGFTAADMATASAQGFRDGVASLTAQAVVQADLITIRKPTTSAEMLWLLKLAHLVISDMNKTLEKTFAPAQPAAQQGVAYAALPDLSDANGEIWSAIIYWKHAKRGEDALRKASELERVLSDQMRAFADATCALRTRGQAPAGATEPTEQQILEAAFAPAQPAAEASRFGSPELQAMIIARCVEKDQADSVLYDPKEKAAESVPAVEREQERIAFKDAHRHLELYEVPDAWGRPMFKHSHVEASWLGWIARAPHGQASSQAGEYPALVCDYCGALTPDPWHSSGMLHGKMSKHIHSCDACAARGAAEAQAAKQQGQLI